MRSRLSPWLVLFPLRSRSDPRQQPSLPPQSCRQGLLSGHQSPPSPGPSSPQHLYEPWQPDADPEPADETPEPATGRVCSPFEGRDLCHLRDPHSHLPPAAGPEPATVAPHSGDIPQRSPLTAGTNPFLSAALLANPFLDLDWLNSVSGSLSGCRKGGLRWGSLALVRGSDVVSLIKA